MLHHTLQSLGRKSRRYLDGVSYPTHPLTRSCFLTFPFLRLLQRNHLEQHLISLDHGSMTVSSQKTLIILPWNPCVILLLLERAVSLVYYPIHVKFLETLSSYLHFCSNCDCFICLPDCIFRFVWMESHSMLSNISLSSAESNAALMKVRHSSSLVSIFLSVIVLNMNTLSLICISSIEY